MIKIGLTGNIGCGKSSVTNILKKYYDIIDADILSRKIFEDAETVEEIKEKFPLVVDENNIIDRKKLGSIVFSDKRKLSILNEITHRRINSFINLEIESLRNRGKDVVILDAALIYESNLDKSLDKVVLVYCDEEIQLNRVMQRDNLNEEEVKNRMKNQMSQDIKAKKADYIIDNSGDFSELEKKVIKLIEKIELWKKV